jgi:hypothetical protein
MSRFHYVFVVCIIAASVASIAGQQAAAPQPNVIREREQQRVKYLVSGDIDGLAKMSSPTLSYSHSNGSIDAREKYLNDLRTRQVVFGSLNHRGVNVRFLTPQVAMLNGLSDVEVKVGEQDLKMILRFTIVYVEKNGEWLFEAWHSSRVQS